MSRAVSTDRVDPELIRARVAAVKDDATREAAAGMVDHALVAVVKLQEVDLAALEREVSTRPPAALWASAADQMTAFWLALEELRQVMLPLLEAADPGGAAPAGDGLNLDAFSAGDEAPVEPGAAPAAVAVPAPAATSMNPLLHRIGETAWAMSFVLSGEVQGFRRRIAALLKLEDSWELVDAVQDHLAHTRNGLVALLNGVFLALPSRLGEDAESEASFELTVARELRSRVFELRDSILDLERQLRTLPPPSWQPLLARAKDAVEAFMFSPGFTWMRAADKRAYLSQRQVLIEVLEMWSPLRAVPARRAIETMARFLEAMQVLNNRESLVAHDRAALMTVVSKLELAAKAHGSSAREAVGAALAALAEAQGRDRELDQLLAQSMVPGNPIRVGEILTRAGSVLRQLGG
ncbi:MAG: hypothetical protein HY903_14965 [Deltaproteobacteria bacterium]|nr:hypothetical protein [Deltaproteobacteria bacterium]